MVSMDYKTLDEAYNAGRRIGIEQGLACMIDHHKLSPEQSKYWLYDTTERLMNKVGYRLYCSSTGMLEESLSETLVDNQDDKE